MNLLRRLWTAAIVIAYTLFPPREKNDCLTGHEPSHGAPSCGLVRQAGIPHFMANPACAMDDRGDLAIFFPDCILLTAPFLLLRLKQTGFSRCKAVTLRGGIFITGRRSDVKSTTGY